MNQPSLALDLAGQEPPPANAPKAAGIGYSIIPDWLLSRPDLSPGAKLCWGRLTRYAHRDGTAWPSLQRIASDLAVGRDQARRYVHELARCKLVKIESKGRAGLTPRYLPVSPVADMPPVALMPPVADMPGEGLQICHGGGGINATLINKRRNKEDKSASAPVVFPDSLDVPEFRAAWESWEGYRKERRQGLTPSTRNRQLAQLAALSVPDAIAAIDQSITKGWQGLFPPKPDAIAATPTAPKQQRLCL